MTKAQAQSIITSNPRLFAEGTQFSQTDLCRVANIEVPLFSDIGILAITRRAQKFHLAKVSAYCDLNKVLRSQGRVIKQRGTNYYVTTLEESERVVASYNRRASTISRNSAILSNGIQSQLVFRGINE